VTVAIGDHHVLTRGSQAVGFVEGVEHGLRRLHGDDGRRQLRARMRHPAIGSRLAVKIRFEHGSPDRPGDHFMMVGFAGDLMRSS
jgi:hypothetical protein